MNAAVWDQCARLLPGWIDAIFVDLPGHGSMREVETASLDDMVRTVAAVTHRPVVWIGWSLGGLVCQRLAVMHPEKTAALFMVASTPKFVQSSSWPHAVEAEVFEQFSALFTQDIDKTVKRFIALQLMGTDNAKQVMQQIDDAMARRGRPASRALEVGLDALRHSDLRQSLVALDKPVGCLLGSNDMLIPVSLASALRALQPAMRVTIQQGAGHAPFLSHPGEFVTALSDFISVSGLRA